MQTSNHQIRAISDRTASAAIQIASLNRISKRFGATHALKNVSLHINRSEVLALLGENGAGKSTLIKILSGVYQPDEGQIVVDGKPHTFATPPDAIAAGVVLIPQELQVADQRSVAENICLGSIPSTKILGFIPILDRNQMRATSSEALARLGSSINPDERASRLSFAERQIVVIARALTNQAKVLILDEPTASLGDADAERLFDVLAGLKKQGVGMVYITHRLPEVRRIAERCVVLRDGQLVGEFSPDNFEEVAVTSAMTGNSSSFAASRASTRRGDIAIEVSIGGHQIPIARGAIVGVAGLIGSGAATEVRKLFGLGAEAASFKDGASQITIHDPRAAIKTGVGFLAGERSLGSFANLTVRDNILLPYLNQFSSPLRIRRKQVDGAVARLLELLDVRPSNCDAKMGSLSGGNQQKVLFARFLLVDLRILLLDEPTAGIDVNAKARIHKLVDDFSRSGGSVVIASTDMPELVYLCDRILAVRSGMTVADLPRNSGFDEAKIRAAMGNT